MASESGSAVLGEHCDVEGVGEKDDKNEGKMADVEKFRPNGETVSQGKKLETSDVTVNGDIAVVGDHTAKVKEEEVTKNEEGELFFWTVKTDSTKAMERALNLDEGEGEREHEKEGVTPEIGGRAKWLERQREREDKNKRLSKQKDGSYFSYMFLEKIFRESRKCKICSARDSGKPLTDDESSLELYISEKGVCGRQRIICSACGAIEPVISCETMAEIPDKPEFRIDGSSVRYYCKKLTHYEILHDLMELLHIAALDKDKARKQRHLDIAEFMLHNARKVCKEWCKPENTELRNKKFLRLREETLLIRHKPVFMTDHTEEYKEMYQMMAGSFRQHREKVKLLLELLKTTLFDNPTQSSFMLWVSIAMMHSENYQKFKSLYDPKTFMQVDSTEYQALKDRYLALNVALGIKKIPVVFILFELPRFYHYIEFLKERIGKERPTSFLTEEDRRTLEKFDRQAHKYVMKRKVKSGKLVSAESHLDMLTQQEEMDREMMYRNSREKERAKQEERKRQKKMKREGKERLALDPPGKVSSELKEDERVSSGGSVVKEISESLDDFEKKRRAAEQYRPPDFEYPPFLRHRMQPTRERTSLEKDMVADMTVRQPYKSQMERLLEEEERLWGMDGNWSRKDVLLAEEDILFERKVSLRLKKPEKSVQHAVPVSMKIPLSTGKVATQGQVLSLLDELFSEEIDPASFDGACDKIIQMQQRKIEREMSAQDGQDGDDNSKLEGDEGKEENDRAPEGNEDLKLEGEEGDKEENDRVPEGKKLEGEEGNKERAPEGKKPEGGERNKERAPEGKKLEVGEGNKEENERAPEGKKLEREEGNKEENERAPEGKKLEVGEGNKEENDRAPEGKKLEGGEGNKEENDRAPEEEGGEGNKEENDRAPEGKKLERKEGNKEENDRAPEGKKLEGEEGNEEKNDEALNDQQREESKSVAEEPTISKDEEEEGSGVMVELRKEEIVEKVVPAEENVADRESIVKSDKTGKQEESNSEQKNDNEKTAPDDLTLNKSSTECTQAEDRDINFEVGSGTEMEKDLRRPVMDDADSAMLEREDRIMRRMRLREEREAATIREITEAACPQTPDVSEKKMENIGGDELSDMSDQWQSDDEEDETNVLIKKELDRVLDGVDWDQNPEARETMEQIKRQPVFMRTGTGDRSAAALLDVLRSTSSGTHIPVRRIRISSNFKAPKELPPLTPAEKELVDSLTDMCVEYMQSLPDDDGAEKAATAKAVENTKSAQAVTVSQVSNNVMVAIVTSNQGQNPRAMGGNQLQAPIVPPGQAGGLLPQSVAARSHLPALECASKPEQKHLPTSGCEKQKTSTAADTTRKDSKEVQSRCKSSEEGNASKTRNCDALQSTESDPSKIWNGNFSDKCIRSTEKVPQNSTETSAEGAVKELTEDSAEGIVKTSMEDQAGSVNEHEEAKKLKEKKPLSKKKNKKIEKKAKQIVEAVQRRKAIEEKYWQTRVLKRTPSEEAFDRLMEKKDCTLDQLSPEEKRVLMDHVRKTKHPEAYQREKERRERMATAAKSQTGSEGMRSRLRQKLYDRWKDDDYSPPPRPPRSHKKKKKKETKPEPKTSDSPKFKHKSKCVSEGKMEDSSVDEPKTEDTSSAKPTVATSPQKETNDINETLNGPDSEKMVEVKEKLEKIGKDASMPKTEPMKSKLSGLPKPEQKETSEANNAPTAEKVAVGTISEPSTEEKPADTNDTHETEPETSHDNLMTEPEAQSEVPPPTDVLLNPAVHHKSLEMTKSAKVPPMTMAKQLGPVQPEQRVISAGHFRTLLVDHLKANEEAENNPTTEFSPEVSAAPKIRATVAERPHGKQPEPTFSLPAVPPAPSNISPLKLTKKQRKNAKKLLRKHQRQLLVAQVDTQLLRERGFKVKEGSTTTTVICNTEGGIEQVLDGVEDPEQIKEFLGGCYNIVSKGTGYLSVPGAEESDDSEPEDKQNLKSVDATKPKLETAASSTWDVDSDGETGDGLSGFPLTSKWRKDKRDKFKKVLMKGLEKAIPIEQPPAMRKMSPPKDELVELEAMEEEELEVVEEKKQERKEGKRHRKNERKKAEKRKREEEEREQLKAEVEKPEVEVEKPEVEKPEPESGVVEQNEQKENEQKENATSTSEGTMVCHRRQKPKDPPLNPHVFDTLESISVTPLMLTNAPSYITLQDMEDVELNCDENNSSPGTFVYKVSIANGGRDHPFKYIYKFAQKRRHDLDIMVEVSAISCARNYEDLLCLYGKPGRVAYSCKLLVSELHAPYGKWLGTVFD